MLPRKVGKLSGAVAVSNDGTVSVAAGTTLLVWKDDAIGRRNELDVRQDVSGASAWADDGERVALGSIVPADGVTVASPWQDAVDSQGGVEQQTIQVLGWIGGDYVVAVRHPESWTEATIDLLPVGTGQERTVGVVDGGVQLDSFTVATDLMSKQRPTVEFAAPEWERDRTWWWVGGGVLVLVAGAAGLVVVRRRA